MNLSRFGELLAQPSAIVDLMEDLGDALNKNPEILFLGGGNPAQIPAAQQLFRQHLSELLTDTESVNRLLGVYQSPQGNEELLSELERYYRDQWGWPIDRSNIAIMGGSQNALFILLNLFAGTCNDGLSRKVALPLVPEYLGYQSQGLSEAHFKPFKPKLMLTEPHRFKYQMDLDSLQFGSDIGAVCISRPTNPSANVISDTELAQLLSLSRARQIPLIVDVAYGSPFPGVVYADVSGGWEPGSVWVMSTSKLGLPGTRTAVVVADSPVIELLVRASTIMNLSAGNLGAQLFTRLLRTGALNQLCQGILPDFYRAQRDYLVSAIDTHLQPFPYRIHEPEGAFFVWLWLESLPISSQELYERMKHKGVLVMGGESFFFGLQDQWDHARQCIRLTYTQPKEVLENAMRHLATELAALY